MKYLSVCSGIEAATVAWHGFGWTPVAFAEVEAFPSAVLAHHYPTVPNLGDLTRYREWPEELLVEVDLLVGGTPCQAFSVAGLRRSLDDERGNLSLTYVNLFHHINEVRKRHGRSPAIALWENVPGCLSTKDNAFGCILGGLLGCDEAPQTESGKWDKAGFLSSETVRVGYRVLDAQYFGVAQRRRRVFLVAVPCELVERLGERACPSEILSLRESVLGNPPTRGAAWEGAAGAAPGGAASGGGCVAGTLDSNYHKGCGERAGVERDVVIDCRSVAGTLNGNGKAAGSATQQDAETGMLVAFGGNKTSGPLDVATSVLAHGGPHGRQDFASETFVTNAGAVAFKPSHFTRGKDGAPASNTPPLSADADKGDQDIVVFTGDGVTADPISAHEARTYTHEGLNFRLHNCVGRIVCATGDKSHALTTRSAVEEDGTGRGTPIVPVAGEPQTFDWQASDGDPMFTIQSTKPHAVAFQANGDRDNPGISVLDQAAFCLPANPMSDRSQAVAFTKAKRAQSNTDDESWVPGDIAPTQNQFDQGETRPTPVVVRDVAASIGQRMRGQDDSCADNLQVVAFTRNSRDEVRLINDDGNLAGALNAEGGMHQTNYLAFSPLQGGRSMPVTPGSPTFEAGTGNKTPAVVFANRTRDGIKVPEVMKDGVVPALTNPGGGGCSDAVNVASAMQVRRLTPTECAYLQGFPADYLDITFRKKPAADGPKYRALGNSMAVPCMWWLGLRIQKATSHD